MPAGPPNGGPDDELYTTSSIPIPSKLGLNDHQIKTFILQQKQKLLLSGKFVAPGHQILQNELILSWRPSETFNSITNPIHIWDSEEELESGRTSPDQFDVCVKTTVHIPLNITIPRDYCRRVAVGGGAVYAVSMFGDLQTVNLKRSTTKTIKEGTKKTNVQDACLVDNSLVYANKDSISVFNILNVEFAHSLRLPNVDTYRLQEEYFDYPSKSTLTCLAPLRVGENLTIITGSDSGLGHWQIHGNKAKYKRLDNSKTRVSAVALRHEETVISSSGRKLRVFDIAESKSVAEGAMSNPINQLKISSDSPNLLALEVSHLDRQIHLFDLRVPLFTKPPVLEMGYRILDINNSKNSRFVKGDLFQNLYVRGYEDGTLNLFDIRKTNKIVTTVLAQRKSPIVHCILSNASSAYAVGKNSFSFVDFNLS